MYNVGHKPKVFQKHVLNKHLHVQCILKYLAGILCIINLITTMYVYIVHGTMYMYNVHQNYKNGKKRAVEGRK